MENFIYAWNGLKAVWREEKNFRIEVVIGVLVTFFAIMLRFSPGELLFCFLAIGIVLGAEVVNTVVEDLCDKIQPENDKAIGKIKDMMAAYVLISCFVALSIGVVIFAYHFLSVI